MRKAQFRLLFKASTQHFWMITSLLDGGIFLAYFQNGGKRVKPKQKVAYLSMYCFDFDDVDIKLYVFCGFWQRLDDRTT